jgi:DNA-binding NarL/FixJ family response regulator
MMATVIGAAVEAATGGDPGTAATGRPGPGAEVPEVSGPVVAPQTSDQGEAAQVRLRVLAVDDDRRFLEEIRELLEDEGFDVAGTASDGSEAVTLADELCPDVVLMDLRMPTLDGLGATRLIKQHLPTTQVVILSAYEDPGLQEGAEEAGVYCYLIKGCRSQLIRDVLLQAWSYKASLEARGATSA